jgi:hypothetical protein
MLTGAEVRAQVKALVDNEEGGGFVGYGEQHMWSHKSGLQQLPYHDDLLVPHPLTLCTLRRISQRHFFAHSWTLINLRITLRPEWTLQHYVIDQI